MPLFLNEADVAALLTMPEAIVALEEAFLAQARGEALHHPRQRFFLPQGTFHQMTAVFSQKGVMGTAAHTSFRTGNRSFIQLFSPETGELLAYLEADRLGQVRTGAATGVATKHMALPGTTTAALFGTGFQAETQAEALVATLPSLREVQVYGRDFVRCRAFCQSRTAALGIHFSPRENPEAAVRGAKVIVTATTAREPIIRGEWLTPGGFIAGVGATRLTARELDEEVIGRAQVVAVDDLAQAEMEAAELLVAYEYRKFDWRRAVPLAAIVAGHTQGRPDAEAITLFKSLGVALEDIALAALVYEKAQEQGLGREL